MNGRRGAIGIKKPHEVGMTVWEALRRLSGMRAVDVKRTVEPARPMTARR